MGNTEIWGILRPKTKDQGSRSRLNILITPFRALSPHCLHMTPPLAGF